MTPEDLYEIWAPAESPWSIWVKPVLFAHLARVPPTVAPVVEVPPWEPPRETRAAIVVDLPGVEAVRMGVRLAERGYRPVPVFNACPGPSPAVEVVPVSVVLAALVEGAEAIRNARLRADAPPAFLMDSERGGPPMTPRPGQFDNRSVVFATDFPSANFLRSRSIERVIVLQRKRLGDDLVELLQDWRSGRLELLDGNLVTGDPPSQLYVPPAGVRWITRLTQRLMVLFLFRKALGGGFGGFVPEASSSG